MATNDVLYPAELDSTANWPATESPDMAPTRVGSIYVVTNKINGKKYIGMTIQGVSVRWNQHRIFSYCVGHKEYELLLHRAIRKYGIESFSVEEVLYNIPAKALPAVEMIYIKLHNSKTPIGYNMTAGGEGIIDPSDETLKKRSENSKKYHANCTPEDVALRSAKTLATREKNKQGNPNYGRRSPCSPEIEVQRITKGQETRNKRRQEDPNYGKASTEAIKEGNAKKILTRTAKQALDPNFGKRKSSWTEDERKIRSAQFKSWWKNTSPEKKAEINARRQATKKQKKQQDPNYLKRGPQKPETIQKRIETRKAKKLANPNYSLPRKSKRFNEVANND